MNIPYVMKRCTCCGEWKVASTVNFVKAKRGKYGLASQCKECDKKYREQNKEHIKEQNKKYREQNKDKITAYKKEWYEQNKDKVLAHQKEYAEQHREERLAYYKERYEQNKEQILTQCKEYRELNKDKIKIYRKQYYKQNSKKILNKVGKWNKQNIEHRKKYMKEYRELNKDKLIEQQKEYHASPRGQVLAFNSRTKRRTKEQAQGNGITKDQWLECMSFFDWECAYSGERLTKDTRSIDHIVPLNSGGDNMIWNCVPMLRSLNSSKHTKDMEEWYKGQSFYDPKRLEKIYKWQEYAYNKWGKDTEYFNTNDIQIKLI